ncbi:MAG TPA: cobalamin-dependent protein [Bacteroidales bacterium]|nr:cobalamin-dependent protein [Bacteroidales bacterium]
MNLVGTNKKHKVVLVRLANPNFNLIAPPIGIGYLMKVLESMDGIEQIFLDCKLHNIDNNSLLNRLIDLQPLLVGFQIFSVDYGRFKKLLPAIKQRLPNCIFVAGGPHISGLPVHTLETNPDLDYAIAGEAEEALPLLVESILSGMKEPAIDQIPNLIYRRNNKIIRNPQKWIDVNAYGAPAWHLLEPDLYPPVQHGTFHKNNRVVPILTSRGCPYPCTFCAGHLVTGKKIRLREIKSVVDEIEWLINTYNFGEFIIEDENFTYYKSHVIEFADEIQRRNIKCCFSFPNGIRLDRIDEEIVSRMSEMGTYMVCLGIESGSRETLTRMGKNWDFDLVRERASLLKRYGIIVNASFILGYRDEAIEDIKQTIDFSLSLPVDAAYFGNYLPLPGSTDFETLIQQGELVLDQISWESYNSYTGVFPYHPRDISERELSKAIKVATIRFYLRPRIMWGILRRMTHLVFLKSFLFRLYGILFRR